MGGIALGADDGSADGLLFNQFLSQALGGLVGGVGADVPEPEEVLENDGRRFSDMTAFADFVESYLGTVQNGASNYRMRAAEQQNHSQRLRSRASQPRQHGDQAESPADQGSSPAAGAAAHPPGTTTANGVEDPGVEAVSGAGVEARSSGNTAAGAMPAADAAEHTAGTTTANGVENPPRPRPAWENTPLAALASLGDILRWPGSSDAGESERVGGGFGSAAQPVPPTGANTGGAAGVQASRPPAAADVAPPPVSTVAGETEAAANTPPSASAPPASSAHELHELVTCDGCGQSPIRGPRWKCTRCPDFDLCDACHRQFTATGRYHTQGHTFNRIAPVPRRRGVPDGRPPVIDGTPRRVAASTPSASSVLVPDVQQLLHAAVRDYDAIRPHMEELRSALGRESELRGIERDRAEGLAVTMAPAVRDLGAIMLDIAPILSNLRMGDEPGHAVVQTSSSMIHLPTGFVLVRVYVHALTRRVVSCARRQRTVLGHL